MTLEKHTPVTTLHEGDLTNAGIADEFINRNKRRPLQVREEIKCSERKKSHPNRRGEKNLQNITRSLPRPRDRNDGKKIRSKKIPIRIIEGACWVVLAKSNDKSRKNCADQKNPRLQEIVRKTGIFPLENEPYSPPKHNAEKYRHAHSDRKRTKCSDKKVAVGKTEKFGKSNAKCHVRISEVEEGGKKIAKITKATAGSYRRTIAARVTVASPTSVFHVILPKNCMSIVNSV